MKGIKFKMKDGTFDYYDPLEEDDFQENIYSYILDMIYKYEILKENVESYEWYDICDICGYEIFEKSCRRCILKEGLIDLKNNYEKIQ